MSIDCKKMYIYNYYIDLEGNIVCKDRTSKKIKNKYIKVPNENAYNQSDAETGFAVNLKMITK